MVTPSTTSCAAHRRRDRQTNKQTGNSRRDGPFKFALERFLESITDNRHTDPLTQSAKNPWTTSRRASTSEMPRAIR